MGLFCSSSDLQTESDVEQKLILPLLKLTEPTGPQYLPSEIRTKTDIRKLTIGKGTERKVYYPDYVIVLAGIPVLLVEAKAPGEDLAEAVREARLYATELNSKFPSAINPCGHTLVTNGNAMQLHIWDTDDPLCSVSFDQLEPSNPEFVKLVALIGRRRLSEQAAALLRKLFKTRYWRAANLAGGSSVRNEELTPNSFGASLVFKYRHLFNPTTKADRAFIVKNAYIPSTRRERYVQQIDKIIRAAAPPSISNAKPIENTARPTEITDWFEQRSQLEHQILLLIGSVGAGKTTFVDYLQEVALPPEVTKSTNWIHVDLNVAPVSKEAVYGWVTEELVAGLEASCPDIDCSSLEILRKIYWPALARIQDGPLALIKDQPELYNARLAEELLSLQKDRTGTATALERFTCTDRARLLVVVLDNCDKRTRDEQLLMFEVAQWIQRTFRCLVVLPLRDITYDMHRSQPPLDTALKDLVYRIEPPSFQKVLDARVKLALRDLDSHSKTQTFGLDHRIRVEYATENLGVYLSALRRAIYEHHAFARKVITGIAGRDIRRAMEVFLEFCNSGYIDEREIFTIIQREGDYSLPYYKVVRVLLRMNRRFFDGDVSYIKNLFQCTTSDSRPDHFVRISILTWLHERQGQNGPSGARGYHRAEALVSDLVTRGHEIERVMAEIVYLTKAMCIVPEHQVADRVELEDLITLGPAGYVHLQLASDVDYLAACAEDTWVADRDLAQDVATRVTQHGFRKHFARETALLNAGDLVKYLERRARDALPRTEEFLEDSVTSHFFSPDTLNEKLAAAFSTLRYPIQRRGIK